jgi:hypothetical protein
MGRWDLNQPVRLVSITDGADFEIDLSAFPEAEPVFAYTDDGGAGVKVLSGLEVTGRLTVPDQPAYMWLNGPRDCVLLKATPEGVRERRASFRSLGVGEFCLEVYHVRPDMSVALLRQDDFCFK